MIMAILSSTYELIDQKLAAFDELQTEFENSFLFVERMQGQERFTSFRVSDAVRYLHALWVCERKTYLLSVSRTVKVYEGAYCLDLLQHWQENGDTASVVAFLQSKLDMHPLAEITRQIHEASQGQDTSVPAQRLLEGRKVLLNRGINLVYLLEALFAPPEADLLREVHRACQYFGHLPAQIAQQREMMSSPLYSFVPHQRLAQRNMLVMNKLGMSVTSRLTDQPVKRSWHGSDEQEPFPPYAEEIIHRYQELTSPEHNNLLATRFVNWSEQKK
jgi:hypothetical protein